MKTFTATVMLFAAVLFVSLAPAVAQDNPLTTPDFVAPDSVPPTATAPVPEVSRRGLPESVPNIFDPEVRARFEPVSVANLRDNPDFPMLLLVNKAGEQPQAMVVGLDARNGKDS